MSNRFEMNPQATGTGLTAAGQSRAQDVATSIPALPGGTYIAGYSALATEVLTALGADLGGDVGIGVANSARTVTSTETAEAANTSKLGT